MNQKPYQVIQSIKRRRL